MHFSSESSLPAALHRNFEHAYDAALFFHEKAEAYRTIRSNLPASRLFPAELWQLRSKLYDLAAVYDETADLLESTTCRSSVTNQQEDAQ